VGGRNNECSVRHFLREAKMRLCFVTTAATTTTTTTTTQSTETNQSKTRAKKVKMTFFIARIEESC